MKSPLLTIALLAVILGCAAWLTYYYQSEPEPGEPVEAMLPVACSSCGKYYVGMLGAQPTKCHYCRSRTAWRAMYCLNAKCHAIFPLEQSEDGKAVTRKCPKCGGGRFTEEVPPDAIKEP